MTITIQHDDTDGPGRVSLYLDGRRVLEGFTVEDAEAIADLLENRHEARTATVHGVLVEHGIHEDDAEKIARDIVAALERLARS